MTDQQIKEAESGHLPPILCHQQVIKHLRDRGFGAVQSTIRRLPTYMQAEDCYRPEAMASWKLPCGFLGR